MKRVAPLSGIVAIGLVIASFAILGKLPKLDAPAGEVVSFFKLHASDAKQSGFLATYGSLFFLFFAASLRKALRRAEADGGGASALGFGGAILFAAGVLVQASAVYALGHNVNHLEPAAAQLLHIINGDFFYLIAVGAAAFGIGNGIAVIKTSAGGRIPAWLGWPLILFGVLSTSPVWFVGLAGFALWILTTSILLSTSAKTT